ncbi:MAG: hypothetical protein AAB667_01770 [Patescibacteria group bacterium]
MNPRKDYQKALDLRLQGKSYGEIRKLFGIPKSTLSVWFKNLSLSAGAKNILESKKRKGFLLLGEFNKERTKKIKQENIKITEEYGLKVKSISERELMLLGAALYWAEGYKNFGKNVRPILSFSNSDPLMIKVFVLFLERILRVSKDKLKGVILAHPQVKTKAAIDYWSEISGISQNNIHIYKTLSSASQRKRPSNLLPHGTFQMRINRRQELFKMLGLIKGITHFCR